jgi:hypothetical protein
MAMYRSLPAVAILAALCGAAHAQTCPVGAYYCRPPPAALTGSEVTIIRQGASDFSPTLVTIVGTTPITPTGGTAATLVALLSGNAPMPATQTLGTPSLQVCNQLSVIGGGCPTNPWEYVNTVALVTSAQGPNIYEVAADFELHAVTGSGGSSLNPANSKVALTASTIAESTAGNVWAQANNLIVRSGWPGSFATNTEFDTQNSSGHACAPGGGVCNIFGLFITPGGAASNESTIGIQMSGGTSGTPGFYYGENIAGYFASQIAYSDTSNAVIGFESWGNHGSSGVGFLDASTAQTGFQAQGTYSGDNFKAAAAASYGYEASSAMTVSAFSSTNSGTPRALIMIDGQKVCYSSTSNCLYHLTANGKWYFTNASNAIVASLDESGNLRTLGTQTASVTP